VDAAQLDPGHTFRLLGRCSCADMILSQKFDVRFEFGVKVAVEIAGLEDGLDPGE
jgi:hypothetical protein